MWATDGVGARFLPSAPKKKRDAEDPEDGIPPHPIDHFFRVYSIFRISMSFPSGPGDVITNV